MPKIDFIKGGTVTSPEGFRAGAVYAGIKKGKKNVLDLGILFSDKPCIAAAVFTKNKVKSSPVLLSQKRVAKGKAIGVVANAGNANACNGDQGMADAVEMAALAAKSIKAKPEDILVCSTGVIGQPLPVNLIKASIGKIKATANGGHILARAIMTTDTVPKETAVTFKNGKTAITIGGIAKGSGMIHPNLGTMFCFITTDAAVELKFLKKALKQAADISFNMVSVDGDTSPSDTVLVLANGLAGNRPITDGSLLAKTFQQALEQVCVYLAKCIARDGEGASKLIEVNVDGAATVADARLAARTIVNSPLVKAAVYGADPNWGRIVVAAGRSGAKVEQSKIALDIGDISVVKGGTPTKYKEASVVKVFQQKEVPVTLHLNLGNGSATAWGCDLTAEYVKINSEYMT